MTEQYKTPLKGLQDNVITHPRFNYLYERIEMCIARTQETGEAHCMALEGCTGAGKSTLAKTYLNTFTRTEEDFGTRIPILYIQTPSPVTVKGMAAKILQELGDPFPEKGQLWGMNSRIVRYIDRCGVTLVILDDIQHLIDQRGRALDEVSNWLKVLIKETNVPFLIIGLEGKVELILEANEQLSRLFASRESLKPFGISDHDGRSEYLKFITIVLQMRNIELDSSITQQELVKRLYFVTNGVVAHTVNLLNDAAHLASKRKSEMIQPCDLREAYARRFGYTSKINPFEDEFSSKFVLPKRDIRKSKTASRKGVQRAQPASDVLTKS